VRFEALRAIILEASHPREVPAAGIDLQAKGWLLVNVGLATGPDIRLVRLLQRIVLLQEVPSPYVQYADIAIRCEVVPDA
jgi:hypothetical protein